MGKELFTVYCNDKEVYKRQNHCPGENEACRRVWEPRGQNKI